MWMDSLGLFWILFFYNALWALKMMKNKNWLPNHWLWDNSISPHVPCQSTIKIALNSIASRSIYYVLFTFFIFYIDFEPVTYLDFVCSQPSFHHFLAVFAIINDIDRTTSYFNLLFQADKYKKKKQNKQTNVAWLNGRIHEFP